MYCSDYDENHRIFAFCFSYEQQYQINWDFFGYVTDVDSSM